MIKRIRSFLFLILSFVLMDGFHVAAQSKDSTKPPSTKRNISFSWGAVPGATKYELKILRKDKAGAQPFFFNTVKSTWSGGIKPGPYGMQMRSFDKRGVPGPWSDEVTFWAKATAVTLLFPKNGAEFLSKSPTETKMQFQWQKIPGVTGYHIHIRSKESDFNYTALTESTNLFVTVPVAQTFTWQVTAVQEGAELNGEAPPADLYEFTILGSQLEPIKLAEELSDVVRVIRWTEPKWTTTYRVALQQQTQKGWRTLVKEEKFKPHELDFSMDWGPGTYRLLVQASSNKRKPSPVLQQTFEVGGGIRKPAQALSQK